ncbi:MAG: prepilin-type N-terminal cleavage/methylation domain-containing protein [Planctomycetaceae bacterium]|nr:prepilin-type N-terminal cleavage/methylation domain-containing protein [Planctomycetaceae bacterium]
MTIAFKYRRPRGGFTLLELQVAIAVLGIGLLSLVALTVRQSRSVGELESWCVDEPTFYVVSQTDGWLQRLGVAADLYDRAGEAPWSPPVAASRFNVVTLDDVQGALSTQTMTVRASVAAIAGNNTPPAGNKGQSQGRKLGHYKNKP